MHVDVIGPCTVQLAEVCGSFEWGKHRLQSLNIYVVTYMHELSSWQTAVYVTAMRVCGVCVCVRRLVLDITNSMGGQEQEQEQEQLTSECLNRRN